MPFADSADDKKKMIGIDEIRDIVTNALGPMETCGITTGNGPAKYYKFKNSKGTVGFIGAMTHNFCAECNRFRLTADGRLMPCDGMTKSTLKDRCVPRVLKNWKK